MVDRGKRDCLELKPFTRIPDAKKSFVASFVGFVASTKLLSSFERNEGLGRDFHSP